MPEIVCLEEDIFKWMCHCEKSYELHKQCQQYVVDTTEDKKRETKVYRFIFDVDVAQLMDYNAHLGNTVCQSTKKASELFQEACFVCIASLDWIPQLVSKSQIVVQICYTSIPNHISCSSIFGLKRVLSQGCGEHLPLFTTIGTIAGMTLKSNYVQSTWYKCVNMDCQSCENGFIQCYPNTSLSEQLSSGVVCLDCGAAVEEDISCRVLGEKSLLRIVSSNGFSPNHYGKEKHHLYRPISVLVRDELINNVQLGCCFSFSLIPSRELSCPQHADTAELNLVFEANTLVQVNNASLHSLPSVPTSLVPLNGFTSKFHLLHSLYEARRSSPWSFAATLAYIFADKVTPRGTYVRLKLALLLSMVSQQSFDATTDINEATTSTTACGAKLHLLAVSRDVVQVQKILLFAKSFLSPALVFSPCNDLCYSLCKDVPTPGLCMVNCGCLPLANNGVCVLTNLSELKADQINALENVLQTQSINVEVPRKYIECEQSQMNIPINCKIWACCETTNKKQSKSQHNTCQILQENGRLSKALVDNFSLVFNLNDIEPVSFGENLIVTDILDKATYERNTSTETVSDPEFSELIKYASALTVTFSDKARELIQGFYLSSRRVRSSHDQLGAQFPLVALKTMMSIAEAHTRLSLRTEVSEDDATLAILLYEESITQIVGYSVLGLNPVHHVKDDNFMAYTGLENDERMTQLKIHVKRFCCLHSNYKYIPGQLGREE